MVTKDFYYELPEELIAQTPLADRSSSKLMVLDKESGEIEHKIFHEISDYLERGDCLVLNNTKVLPARLFGVKEETGAHVEFLLLSRKDKDMWEVIAKPAKRVKPGTKFVFGNGELRCEVIDCINDGNRLVKFFYDGLFENVLDKLGEVPLPPYIKEKLEDKNRYQTVYSKHEGSAAAPTAGLHFTKEMLSSLENKGVKIAFVTLHIGLGTFRPVKAEKIEDHKMHSEFYVISEETAEIINSTKQNGGKIIAVGTTSVRTLESAAKNGQISACSGWTDIFIYPPYKFQMVDKIITNFHLPESTLIMLISAFAGTEKVLNAYKQAVAEKYRFFSFGDAMFIK